MKQSEMRKEVEKLIKASEPSMSKIADGSGVHISTIKKLRSGQRGIDSVRFRDIEKLYLWIIEDRKE